VRQGGTRMPGMTAPASPAASGYVRGDISRPAAAAGPSGRLAGAAGLRVPSALARWAGHLAADWPLQSFLELGALDGAVPSARLHARHVLSEWGRGALADDAEVVVSELVTNAIQASRAMTHAAIRLWLATDGLQVLICVWDASPQPPTPIDAADDAENGRGLLLVEALSKQWDWFPAEPGSPPDHGHHGKIVWAVV
jgi:anti-sigma regulatory factor (Ser/Thr protein kinase)